MNRSIRCALTVIVIIVFPFSGFGDELTGLFQEGNASYSAADYVTAVYYYQRIVDSDQWTSFPNRTDVLRKLAMIEESQAQFEKAAEHYRQLIGLLPPVTNGPGQTMYHFYMQRYAENLERIGYYEKASQVLLKIVRQSESGNRLNYLKLLIENYGFQQLSNGQITELRDIIIPQYLESLGWEFASLLYGQGKSEESIELFEKLWPVKPDRACEFASVLAELYSSTGQMDDLIQKIHNRENENVELSALFVLLETTLLEEISRGEEALQRLEQFARDRIDLDSPGYVERLMLRFPAQLIDRWIDLIVRYRDSQQAIQLLEDILKQAPMDLKRGRRLSDLLVNEGKKQQAVDYWSQWARSQSKIPTAVLNAAQEIFSLGDVDSARQLILRLKDTIPPPLAWRQGQASLQFGDFPNAIAAFHIAVVSGGIPPVMISSVIDQYAQTKTNKDELVAHLIHAASGKPYVDLPVWIKKPVLEYGIQPIYRHHLQDLLAEDGRGVWKYNAASEAMKHGYTEWALNLLEDIPKNSLYGVLAGQKTAEILAGDPTVTAQRRAAELMQPSVDGILSASDSDALNPVMVDRLLDYADLCLNAFLPNETLTAIRKIESASGDLEQLIPVETQSRLLFSRGRALTELASFGPAIECLESIDTAPYEENAQFLLARIYIAQRKTDIAFSLLHAIVDTPNYWRSANDAMVLLTAMEPLVGDSLELFCDAMMYELQGRLSSAVPALRQLAVEYFGDDVEEWARYYIGKLKKISGETGPAQDEWQRLLVDVDHPVIQGMTRLELLRLDNLSSGAVGDMTGYQDLMLQLPNTLFSDLARLQMQEKFGKEQP